MKNNKILNPFYAFLILAISVFMVGCEGDINDENYLSEKLVSFSFDPIIILAEGDTGMIEGEVYASTASTEDRTFTIYVDEATSTATMDQILAMPYSVTIPAGSLSASMEFNWYNDGNLGFGGKTIVVGMQAVAGVDQPTSFDGNFSDGSLVVSEGMLTVTAKDFCPDIQLSIEIELDNYPEEFYWYITDASGNVVASPGPYAQYDNPYSDYPSGYEILVELCLPAGSYTFYSYDDYGDGGGPIKVTSGGVTIYETDGTYASGENTDFTL
tara:strand:+ start:11689 stop:12498 length:810 start_codon:yes stop_codon:yes gene_type:complete